MPCFFVILGLLLPRLTILILWFFTSWFDGVFEHWILPVLGFIFLPLSTLWYSAVQQWYLGEWTFVPILLMVLSVIIDLSSHGNSARKGWERRQRRDYGGE
jgi:hypothetical protein